MLCYRISIPVEIRGWLSFLSIRCCLWVYLMPTSRIVTLIVSLPEPWSEHARMVTILKRQTKERAHAHDQHEREEAVVGPTQPVEMHDPEQARILAIGLALGGPEFQRQ